ncbi:hypothetical protein ACFSUD_19310 [Sulfitobacter aestuarii]|uniref:Uncharacterized protein n=1 Tax=Sulfitobacter aestuarii TaxID=2161676 RepID=A0ABW5U745_9RHOB
MSDLALPGAVDRAERQIEELTAQNRQLIAQVEALRTRLQEYREEITTLTRLLEQSDGSC